MRIAPPSVWSAGRIARPEPSGLAIRIGPSDNDGIVCRRVGSPGVRSFLYVAAALALCFLLAACDRCGDPVKINFPGVNACSDSK